MNAQEKKFWIILFQYWRYKLGLFPPLPLLQFEQNFGILFLMNLYQTFSRLTRRPLPHYLFNIRTRMLENELNGIFVCKDVYGSLISRPFEFWILSGENFRSFNELVEEVSQRVPDKRFGIDKLSLTNRVLMTLVWLRQYPTYTVLSLAFGISLTTVGRIINTYWVLLWEIVHPVISWPSLREWRSFCGNWPEMPNVIGCIDGTSHEILMPNTENQAEFYSGHRKYHCIHTQVIIDNKKNIRYVHSGFLGHENDAGTYQQIGPIGPGQQLDFPGECYFLADGIYPNEHPLVTPYKSTDIIRRPPNEQRKRRKFNLLHRQRRVYVEHVIKELKTYQVIGSLYRHPRWQLAPIVELCVGLSKRHADSIALL